MIILELAWKPLCVVIILVNSAARSTFDISSAPTAKLPERLTSSPTPSNVHELSVAENNESPSASRPDGFENVATAICARSFFEPLLYVP